MTMLTDKTIETDILKRWQMKKIVQYREEIARLRDQYAEECNAEYYCAPLADSIKDHMEALKGQLRIIEARYKLSGGLKCKGCGEALPNRNQHGPGYCSEHWGQ